MIRERSILLLSVIIVIFGVLLLPGGASAAALTPPAEAGGFVLLVAALPLVAILLACYVKIAVVLAILRSAFGGSSIPPRSVTAALAVLLAVFVMAPVAERAFRAAEPALLRGDAAALVEAGAAAREPLREFLARHAPARERQTFFDLARRLRPVAALDPNAARSPADRPLPEAVSDRDLLVLAPAFVTAELKAAFQVGFLLFLPFLVLELVVASLLAALGMHSLDARRVALPFKLLLFVVADGWHLLARGLILGYT